MCDRLGKTAGGELSVSTVHEILSNQRRRAVLRYLDEHTETPLIEIAEHIAGGEDRIRRVYVELYQIHLPALDQYGVVDFDREQETVGLRSRAAPVLSVDEMVESLLA